MNLEHQRLLDISECSDDDEDCNLRYPRNKGWTKLEKILCFATVFLSLLLFTALLVLAAFGYIYQRNINSSDDRHLDSKTNANQTLSNSDFCLTPGCVKAASEILSNIDESVDPCIDFYNFACGGWIKRHPIHENDVAVAFFTESKDELNLQLKALLEAKPDEAEPDFVSIVKNMYRTCMNLQEIEKADSDPLKKSLKSLGGWPVVEGINWNGSEFDWIETLRSFRKLGYGHTVLLDMSVTVDYRNNSLHIIRLGECLLGMPDRSFYLLGLNDSTTAAYFNMMVKSAQLLGVGENTARRELIKALNFETALASFTLPLEEMRNMSRQYNKYSVQELQIKVPQVSWLKYFNAVLGYNIDENEPLLVEVPEFIIKFAHLITTTDKRVIANYMMWRVVLQSIPFLSKQWGNLLDEYSMVYAGITQDFPRWQTCLTITETGCRIALSSYYLRHYFDEENKKAAEELFRYIHKSFLNSLEEIDWMEENTKQEAKAKAKIIRPYIGYPKELLNSTFISEFYKNLTIADDSFFDNIVRLRKWSNDFQFSQLRKPNIKKGWLKYTKVTDVNAYYKTLENEIEILAGILRSGFFDKDRPHFMNFGALGFLIAHELTHGFDDIGRQFDKDGNNVNWWDKTTEEQFKKKSQCFVHQYSNYTADNGMKLNGVITIGENIADNGGLKHSYKAYQLWTEDNGLEQKLPAVKYTPKQLFWISMANIWCENDRPEALKLRILTGSHSLSKFRITGGMSNLDDFSHDFNCSPNSPMNKKHKCTVW